MYKFSEAYPPTKEEYEFSVSHVLENLPSLTDLPEELIIDICENLNLYDLTQLKNANRQMYRICNKEIENRIPLDLLKDIKRASRKLYKDLTEKYNGKFGEMMWRTDLSHYIPDEIYSYLKSIKDNSNKFKKVKDLIIIINKYLPYEAYYVSIVDFIFSFSHDLANYAQIVVDHLSDTGQLNEMLKP